MDIDLCKASVIGLGASFISGIVGLLSLLALLGPPIIERWLNSEEAEVADAAGEDAVGEDAVGGADAVPE